MFDLSYMYYSASVIVSSVIMFEILEIKNAPIRWISILTFFTILRISWVYFLKDLLVGG